MDKKINKAKELYNKFGPSEVERKQILKLETQLIQTAKNSCTQSLIKVKEAVVEEPKEVEVVVEQVVEEESMEEECP